MTGRLQPSFFLNSRDILYLVAGILIVATFASLYAILGVDKFLKWLESLSTDEKIPEKSTDTEVTSEKTETDTASESESLNLAPLAEFSRPVSESRTPSLNSTPPSTALITRPPQAATIVSRSHAEALPKMLSEATRIHKTAKAGNLGSVA